MSTGKIISLIKSLGGAGGTGTSDLPFGTEVTYTEILPQETVTVAATEGSSALTADLTGLVPIEVGKKYRVTFDGVAYVCVAYKHASWGAICLGNGRLNGGSTEKTDEPFCINVWASTAASISLVTEGTHTVSVDEIVETHTPIQPEYLTGEKPQPYMQLVTDGEGKAGWEERLAWKESEKVEITWDGNTEGLEKVNVGTSDYPTYAYKVSDIVFSDKQIIGGTVTAFGETISVAQLVSMQPDQVYVDENLYVIGAFVMFVKKDNVQWGNAIFEAGVYFGIQNDTFLSNFTSGYGDIKLIDPDLINLILPETALVATASGSGSGRTYVGEFTPLSEINEGDYVRVIADGVNYNARVGAYSGNPSVLGFYDVHSGEDLRLSFADGGEALITNLENGQAGNWKVLNKGSSWTSCTLAMYRMTPADLPGPTPAYLLQPDVINITFQPTSNPQIIISDEGLAVLNKIYARFQNGMRAFDCWLAYEADGSVFYLRSSMCGLVGTGMLGIVFESATQRVSISLTCENGEWTGTVQSLA